MRKGENIKSIDRLVENYEAEQINFLDQRFYKRNGEYYPSVTSVLSFFPKGKFFEDWLKQVGNNAKYIANESADKGTKVHKLIDQWLTEKKQIRWIDDFGNAKYDLDVWKMFLRFTDFWDQVKPKLVCSETHLYSDELKVAGTCDLVLDIENERWLLDNKTSNHLNPSYDLQLAAYKKCWEENYSTKIDRTGVLWLKSTKRIAKGLQGKGWEVVESKMPYDYNIKMFNSTHDLYKMLNPNAVPIFDIVSTMVEAPNIY